MVLLCRLEPYYLRRLHQPVALEDAVAGGFRDREGAGVGDLQGKLPGAQLRRGPGQSQHGLLLLRPQPVPGHTGTGLLVFQGDGGPSPPTPAVVGGPGQP